MARHKSSNPNHYPFSQLIYYKLFAEVTPTKTENFDLSKNDSPFLRGHTVSASNVFDRLAVGEIRTTSQGKLNEEEMAYVLDLFGVKFKKETRKMAKRLQNAP